MKDKLKSHLFKGKGIFSTLGIFIIILILIFIIVSIVGYIIFQILTSVKKKEIFFVPRISEKSYLDVDFIFQDFTNETDFYRFGFYLENLFEEDINITVFSKLEIPSTKNKLIISEYIFSDTLQRNNRKRYDIKFDKIFDNSKISGLNFCDTPKPLVDNPFINLECYKDQEVRNNEICWENCKLYDLSSPQREKNLYCAVGAIITTSISYSTKITGLVEIPLSSKEDKYRWNIIDSPITIYVRPSPLPINNLLPLNLAFEVIGDDVYVRNITVEVLNYSIEIETFLKKRIETVEKQKPCIIQLNRFVNGKIYLSGEEGCEFQPIQIMVKEITRDDEILEKIDKEKIDNFLKFICKDFVSNNGIDYENCAKELNRRGYDTICNLHYDLEICKVSELTSKIVLLIKVEFDRKENFKKAIYPAFC